MHIQIINFNPKGLSEAEYSKLCNDLAPAFAALPGLVAKVWLADAKTNTFGGVYTWRDRESMENFTRTNLFKAVATHPNLANITSRDFSVMEAPIRVTRGLIPAGV